MNRKISFPVAIIIILAVALASVGAVLYCPYFKISNENLNLPPIQRDETIGWKKYTNTQYGFEIKYPSNISLGIGDYPDLNYWYISFHYNNDPKGGPLVIRVEKSSLGKMTIANSHPIGEKNIAGIKGDIIVGDASGSCQEIFVNTTDLTYIFSNNCGQNQNLFDTMVSTFKFTNQNQIGCNTDSDCQNGASCMVEGPIIANQSVHKVCVPKGQAVPL